MNRHQTPRPDEEASSRLADARLGASAALSNGTQRRKAVLLHHPEHPL
jgi:hypothetical protein